MQEPQAGNARSRRRRGVAIFLAVLVLAGSAAAEWWARTRARIPDFKDERRLFYQYDAGLGWLPRASSESTARMTREFRVRHNAQHFRDREHIPTGKPAICVLGDSFVWGFDVEAEERFTDLLQGRLPAHEVWNLGVSGYSTDQELLLLQREFERLRPGLVLLLFSCDPDGDDRKANSSNKAYRYFKPYFTPAAEELAMHGRIVKALDLHGVPVPKNSAFRIDSLPSWLRKSAFLRYVASRLPEPQELRGADPTHAILAEMQRWLAARGAKLVLARNDPDAALDEFCRASRIPLVDLAFIGERYRYPGYGRHWTPEGHALAADALHAALQEHLPPAAQSDR